MDCPHCGKEIETRLIAREFGRCGGLKSRRAITPDQQELMKDGLRRRVEDRKLIRELIQLNQAAEYAEDMNPFDVGTPRHERFVKLYTTHREKWLESQE